MKKCLADLSWPVVIEVVKDENFDKERCNLRLDEWKVFSTSSKFFFRRSLNKPIVHSDKFRDQILFNGKSKEKHF